jgi:MFS family permease
LAAAGLCFPALIALSRIRSDEIDYARARNAGTGDAADKFHRVVDVAKNRSLLIFAACLILFQLANASLLPLLGETLGANKAAAGSIMISGLIIVPQIIVAILAPWVGYHSEMRGRKPLLLIGLGAETIRAGLFAVATNYPFMVAIQVLDGISGSIINVLTVLIITDLTAGTGRFNLTQGAMGAMLGIAASLSTSVSGFIFQNFGRWIGFLALAAIAAVATALAWVFVPETKPEKYQD